MIHRSLIDQLKTHEGLRLTPYRCSAGKLTIGIGRNLEGKGITEQEAYMMLSSDIKECKNDLQYMFPMFANFSQQRRWALIDMRFNLGPNRFRSFKRMIAAIQADNWDKAALEAVDSVWSTQVQEVRVRTIQQQLRRG